jgi:hypothetical protein
MDNDLRRYVDGSGRGLINGIYVAGLSRTTKASAYVSAEIRTGNFPTLIITELIISESTTPYRGIRFV